MRSPWDKTHLPFSKSRFSHLEANSTHVEEIPWEGETLKQIAEKGDKKSFKVKGALLESQGP